MTLILFIQSLLFIQPADLVLRPCSQALTLDDLASGQPSAAWTDCLAEVRGFVQRVPLDGAPASFETVAYLTYDATFLYVGFVAFDPQPELVRANLAPRETVVDDDFVSFTLDTFNDQRRGTTFLCTARGIQWDARWIEGSDFDSSYEALWYCDAQVTDFGYVALIRVPFTTLRFDSSSDQTWRIMLNRYVARLNEDSFYPEYSQKVEGRLNQAAIISGITGLKPGRNLQVVPFGFHRDFSLLNPENTGFDEGSESDIGVDAKLIIKDRLVLDATINPDFSQVESDEPQTTVNQRFEVFFPERRPFFLENADFLQTPTNLMFTRRIADPSAGLRLTGKSGDYGVGMVLIDDEAPGGGRDAEDPLSGERAETGVLRVTRDLGDQSQIGVFASRRDFADRSNSVYALDGRYKFHENWTAVMQSAWSDSEGEAINRGGALVSAYVNHNSRRFNSHSHYVYSSPGFEADLGFLGQTDRPGQQNFHQSLEATLYGSGGSFLLWRPSIFVQRFWTTQGEELDDRLELEAEFEWQAGTELSIEFTANRDRLLPEQFAGLAQPTDFDNHQLHVQIETKALASLQFSLELAAGKSTNLVPPEGQAPSDGRTRAGQLEFIWRPISPLRLDFAWLYTRLEDETTSDLVFVNRILQSKWNWQFSRALSARVIVDYESISPNTELTSLTRERNLNMDVLVRYVLNPWTAAYVGYNRNDSNMRLVQSDSGQSDLVFDNGLHRDSRQFFLKVSYLFQF